jgi:hypothetical protein
MIQEVVMQVLNRRRASGHGTAANRSRPHVLFDVGLVLIGLALLIGGVRLVRLGASWDYVIAGAAVLITGFVIVRGRLAVAELFPRR